jgi:hypothetical protein
MVGLQDLDLRDVEGTIVLSGCILYVLYKIHIFK